VRLCTFQVADAGNVLLGFRNIWVVRSANRCRIRTIFIVREVNSPIRFSTCGMYLMVRSKGFGLATWNTSNRLIGWLLSRHVRRIQPLDLVSLISPRGMHPKGRSKGTGRDTWRASNGSIQGLWCRHVACIQQPDPPVLISPRGLHPTTLFSPCGVHPMARSSGSHLTTWFASNGLIQRLSSRQVACMQR
jgi:hypothetical protein